MRIISQDGMIDVPYEQVVIQRFEEKIYFLNKNLTGVENLVDDIKLASYSDERKAQKAMEMLRSQCAELEMIKILECGRYEYMQKTLNSNDCKEMRKGYCNKNIFRFPADEELED